MCRDDLKLPMLLTPRLLLGGAFVLGTCGGRQRSGIDAACSDVEAANDGGRKSMRRVLRC